MTMQYKTFVADDFDVSVPALVVHDFPDDVVYVVELATADTPSSSGAPMGAARRTAPSPPSKRPTPSPIGPRASTGLSR